jgi:hypothetical protein
MTIAPLYCNQRAELTTVGMGGDDWFITYGGSGLFMLIPLIHRPEC